MDNDHDETAQFREALGPELDYLADGLAPAVGKLVEKAVTKATAPIKAQAQNLTRRAAMAETEGVVKAFGERHPDWKDHEEAMLSLGEKLQPTGMSSPEYLEALYGLVTREQRERAREARDAPRAASSRPAVTGHAPTFREAFDAAKRGERFED